METLITLLIETGAKRCKTINVFLDIGASKSLLVPELSVDMLKDHKISVSKMPKSTWSIGMVNLEVDEELSVEDITLTMLTVNRKFPITFAE